MRELLACAQALLGLLPTVLRKLVLSGIVVLVYVGLRWFLVGVLRRRVRDESRRFVATKTVAYALGLVAALLVVRLWLGGASGLLAYLGILSAGVAIALQAPLVNLAAWLFILARRPFKPGDRIEIGALAGDIVDIGPFQFSLLEVSARPASQSTGRLIHVPNGWVFNQSIANATPEFGFLWNEIEVTVSVGSNWRKAREILVRILSEETTIASQAAQEQIRQAYHRLMISYEHLTPVVWTSVTQRGIVLTMRYPCAPRQGRSSASRIWERVLSDFEGQ